jgi:class 3 adenylate cyclase/pSer/pThr/pTyr-binding forkhead associated (FHA) protein
MYSLTITSPRSEPLQIKLKSGKMVIGRMVTSDIVINDIAASRRHAEIYYDAITEVLTINDLKSSNGTYVNRQKISGLFRLHDGDVIRIGQTEMHLAQITEAESPVKDITGTRSFTRELVLEAVDEHPIALNELTEELNTVMDVRSATDLVTDVVKKTLGVDECKIILAADFNKINMEKDDDLRVRTIRNASLESSPLSMCVPVISGGKPYGLIYVERKRAEARPFDKRDMQLIVGISHQTALTIQRIELLEKVRTEGQIKQLLLRFVSPIEADEIVADYLKTGSLPGLTERKVTVLFAEIYNSSALAERIGPKKFSTYLNTYYQNTIQIVFKNSGVAKFLGDGVLAVFMEIKNKPSHEERAAMVAREILDFVKREAPPEPDQPCVVGIAINTGKAMVGYVGSQERSEFNVTGNLIRVTYRMQEYAFPSRVFIGEATAEALRNKYPVKKAGNLALKTSEQPIPVHEVTFTKTMPFIDAEKGTDFPAAFKAIAEKLRSLSK